MLRNSARWARSHARRLMLLPMLLVAAGSAHASTAPAATLTRGFEDDVWFNAGWQPWVKKTVATGAKIVSLEIDWEEVEPHPPAGSGSSSPSSPQYNFLYVDGVLKRFAGTGIQPLLLITDAPRWAQGSGGTPLEYEEGGFEPNDAALQQLVQALAKRYSGHYRDPANPRHFLPRVRYFQAWAEANTGFHLSPQWERVGGHLVNEGPIIYRNLLNAFYSGVKAGNPAAQVVFTGLAPYGDPPGGLRTPPVTFLRSVLCLDAHLRRQSCPDPAHFSILASDPYDIGSPTTHAVSSTDASAPDLGRLTRIVRAAITARTVLPASAKPLWVTEFGYDSNPPNTTRGTPSEAEQARWLEESFYVFAHEGVSTVIWYLLHDQTGSFLTRYFSGVYFNRGGPKLSLTAYQFPLVVMPDDQHAQAWGIAKQTGTVSVERREAGSWQTIFRFQRIAGAEFNGTLPLGAYGLYRAVEGTSTSLVWSYYREGTSRGSGAPVISLDSPVSASG